MAQMTRSPLFVAVLLLVTLFAVGSTLPLIPATAVVLLQTLLAGRWLYRYGREGER